MSLNLVKHQIDIPRQNPFLLDAYMQKERVYHDIGHIHDLLHQIDKLNLDPETTQWLCVVAWFHDAHYGFSGPSGENEQISAERLKQSIHGLNDFGLEVAVETILATARHTEDQKSLHPLTEIFLDLDLCGLGQSYENFSLQTEKITTEYQQAGFLLNDILKGRGHFYLKMLQRDRIYYTNHFFERQELAARDNMKKGLAIVEKTPTLPHPPKP